MGAFFEALDGQAPDCRDAAAHRGLPPCVSEPAGARRSASGRGASRESPWAPSPTRPQPAAPRLRGHRVTTSGRSSPGSATSAASTRTATAGRAQPDHGAARPRHGQPFFVDIARGAERAARDAGLGVMVCNSAQNPAEEAEYLSLFAEQRVRGALITPPTRAGRRCATSGATAFRTSSWTGSPVTRRGARWRSTTCRAAPWRSAALLTGGHRSLAFVSGPPHLRQVRTAGGRPEGARRGGPARHAAARTAHRAPGRGGRRDAAPASSASPTGPRPSSAPTTCSPSASSRPSTRPGYGCRRHVDRRLRRHRVRGGRRRPPHLGPPAGPHPRHHRRGPAAQETGSGRHAPPSTRRAAAGVGGARSSRRWGAPSRESEMRRSRQSSPLTRWAYRRGLAEPARDVGGPDETPGPGDGVDGPMGPVRRVRPVPSRVPGPPHLLTAAPGWEEAADHALDRALAHAR